MNTHEGCPFKKINNRIQEKTKTSICKTMKQKQATKHKEYVDILKVSFQSNADYYINIDKHITMEDIETWSNITNHDLRIQFINTKIKEYFWRGISFDDINSLTIRESLLTKIGNLWLDDVTTILAAVLSQKDSTLDSILAQLDQEINVRLKNNVLIDSIIHWDNFPDMLVTKDPENSAALVWSILEDNFMAQRNRFSPDIIPTIFIEPMKIDGMIDAEGVIPQLTFGCPVGNVGHGQIFRSFVTTFIQCFLGKTMVVNSKSFNT